MNNNNKKTLSMFLTEANKTENKNNRESYWDDPNLFSNSDEWISKIQKGDIQLDTSPFLTK